MQGFLFISLALDYLVSICILHCLLKITDLLLSPGGARYLKKFEEIKISEIQRVLMEKASNMQDQMGNVISQMEAIRKNEN